MTRIRRVLAPNPGPFTLEGTNTWVVGAGPAVVIDPGPDDEHHLAEVHREAGSVGAILLTHDHPDHAPGAGRLAASTGAPVLAVRPPSGGRQVRDEERVEVGSTVLRVLLTPGHAADHACFLLEDGGALFTGDTVLGRGTTVIAPPDGDLGEYLRSLERLRGVSASVIHPGHGPLVLDPARVLDQYLRHREQREREILAALEEDPRRVEDLLPVIYPDLGEGLRRAAAAQILAHLTKLEREGRAVRSGPEDHPSFAAAAMCRRCGRPVRGPSRLCGRCSVALLQEAP